MRRRFTAVLATAALTVGLLPLAALLTAQSASAATSTLNAPAAVTGQGTSYGGGGDDNRAADTQNTLTGTGTFSGTAPDATSFNVTAGPDSGETGTCSNTPTTATDFTYSCAVQHAPAVGNDTVQITSGTASTSGTIHYAGRPLNVTQSPGTDNVPVGTCNAFQVSVITDTPDTPTPSPLAPVDVNVDSALQNQPGVGGAANGAGPAASSVISFCDPTANGGPSSPGSQNFTKVGGAPENPQMPVATVPAGNTITGEFTADQNGIVTFGISSSNTAPPPQPGGYTVTSYVETVNENEAVDGTQCAPPAAQPNGSNNGQTNQAGTATANPTPTQEPCSASSKVFTAGGANAVGEVFAEPQSATNVVGQPHTIFATLCTGNATPLAPSAGSPAEHCNSPTSQPVPGVTPTASVIAGPNNTQSLTCTASDQQGVSRCTYTGTNAGPPADTIHVVGGPAAGAQTSAGGGSNSSPNPTKNYVTGTLKIDTNVGDVPATSPTQSSPSSSAATIPCENTFDTSDAGTLGQPSNICAQIANSGTGAGISNQDLTFTVSGVGNFTNCGNDTAVTPNAPPGTENLGASVATKSDANGFAAVCLITTKPGTATITVSNPGGLTSTGTITFATQPSQARSIALTPKTQTVPPGANANVTATVTDQFGNPVSGVTVTFSLSGAGSFTSGANPQTGTTDANGTATVSVVNPTPGTGTLTATIPSAGTQCAQGNCTDTATVNWAVTQQSYSMVAGDGGIFSFNTPFFGSTGNLKLNKPVVGMAYTRTGKGYYLVASDGGVFAFGDAQFFGSTGNIKLNSPVVGMRVTQGGQGYYLVAADGGIFSFGSDAQFFGSTGNIRLNKPVVGMGVAKTGQGYWLAASDGGVFSFGPDAHFFGSTGNIRLNSPVVGFSRTPDGGGYWFVAADGGVFTFGNGNFFGSTGNIRLNKPVVGMTALSDGSGYWLFASDGGVFSFGGARFQGSMGGKTLNSPVVGGDSTLSAD